MKSLCIVKPVTSIVAGGAIRILTPDPKEAIVIDGGDLGVTLDFGVPVTVDTIFLGYHTGGAVQGWSLNTTPQYNAGADTNISGGDFSSLGYGNPTHVFRQFAPATSRYWRIYFSRQGGAPFTIGTLALGLSWSSKWGQEMGAGRQVIDTGTAERLFGGGFAIDEGARAGGYQWTFGDLQADEIRSLYQIVKDRGSTRSVLVVEDPEQTDGLNERIHWGLFERLDFYERSDPTNWRWALRISDWI